MNILKFQSLLGSVGSVIDSVIRKKIAWIEKSKSHCNFEFLNLKQGFKWLVKYIVFVLKRKGKKKRLINLSRVVVKA